jgi:hypothetical protein
MTLRLCALAPLRFLLCSCALAFSALADGVPEPGLVMYGVVRDNTSGGAVYEGDVTWTIVPRNGGAAITISAPLTNLNNREYSYRLRVPFEALLGSSTLSASALRENANVTEYDRAQVLVNGTNAATMVSPTLPTFTFQASERGKVERVDLLVSLPEGSNPGRSFVDTDGDGVSDADELRAGTNPNDPNDYLHFTSIKREASGAVALKWRAVGNRSYSLMCATNGASGAYNALRTNIPGAFPDVEATITNLPDARPVFFRLRVE